LNKPESKTVMGPFLPSGFDPALFAALIYAVVFAEATLAMLAWIAVSFLTVWLVRLIFR
jgi:hypothetical protein